MPCVNLTAPLHGEMLGQSMGAVFEDDVIVTCEMGHYFSSLNTNTLLLTCSDAGNGVTGVWDRINDLENCSRRYLCFMCNLCNNIVIL